MTLTPNEAIEQTKILAKVHPEHRRLFCDIEAAMQQAQATIAEQGKEIERLKMHHSFNPSSLDKYPNLEAVMAGCVSGSPSEWPLIRREIKDMAAEIDRLRQLLQHRPVTRDKP